LGTIDTMRVVRPVAPVVKRIVTAAAAGLILMWLGWQALSGNDAASPLMGLPFFSIGTTLLLVSSGAACVTLMRFRRGEPISPIPHEPAPAPLPRAIVRPRR
jgi:hypothetical protein